MAKLVADGQVSVSAAVNLMHDAPSVANNRERAPGRM
jgi:hypothetical protein